MGKGRIDRFNCEASVTGHGSVDIQGCCPWCGIKLEAKQRRLAPQIGATTEIDDAYGYHWDPDYGIPQ